MFPGVSFAKLPDSVAITPLALRLVHEAGARAECHMERCCLTDKNRRTRTLTDDNGQQGTPLSLFLRMPVGLFCRASDSSDQSDLNAPNHPSCAVFFSKFEGKTPENCEKKHFFLKIGLQNRKSLIYYVSCCASYATVQRS